MDSYNDNISVNSDMESDISDIEEVDIMKDKNYLILSSFFEDSNGHGFVDRLNSLNNTQKKNNLIMNNISININKLTQLFEMYINSKQENNSNNLNTEELNNKMNGMYKKLVMKLIIK